VTRDEEIEAERKRRKTNKHTAMSLFYAELHRQAKGEVQTLRDKHRRNADNSRTSTGPCAEPRAEMTQEERIKAREIISKYQRASRTRRALRFVGTATGELEIFQEQFHRRQPPIMEEICQFFQAVRWKDRTTNSCCRSGKIVLARLHDPPQEFKQLSEDPLFLVKVRGESLAENSRIDEQMQRLQTAGTHSVFKEQYVRVSVLCYLFNQEHQPLESCMFLIVIWKHK
jgi:hypothetical protein